MDDEPMWAANRVVALTPGSAITIPETANEFAIKGNHLTLIKGNQFDGRTKTDPHKHIYEFLGICDMFKYRDTENEAVRLMMFPLSLTGEAKTWIDDEGTIKTEIRAFSQHENESQTNAWLRIKEILRNCHGHNLSKGNIIKIFYHGLNEITQEVLNVAASGSSNFDTDKIMARMDAMTMKMDAQYKDFQSRSKQSNLDDDDITMSREEEAKFMQTFRPKFDRLADKQSGRPSGSLPSLNLTQKSGKSYDPPDNPNDQQNDSETPINFDSDAERPNYGKFLKELVQVGKFTFLADFVILEMEEDSKVPLILRRPFLHTADAVIRVKQKQLNLGVGTERMIFHIDFAMKHSYSNNDTRFSIDVIDEFFEEDFDALLDEGSEILHSIKGTILEEKLFAEFDEFMAIIVDENSESESDTKEPPFEKITFNTNYKIKTSLEELPTDLELKPLPDNLEYVFLKEPSFLPVIISSKFLKKTKINSYLFLKNTSKPLLGKPQTFLESVHLSVNIKFNS
ncbi:reverse transcriptase domain-containing protein [Tanacetum coccineum]